MFKDKFFSFFEKNSSKLLVITGSVGVIATGVLATKATIKAVRAVDELTEQEGEQPEAKTIVKVCWKYYIPTFVAGIATILCYAAAKVIDDRKSTALATVGTIATTTLEEYKEATKEVVGAKKEKEIHEKVAEKKAEKNPPDEDEIIITETGNTLCQDMVFGRYLRSNWEGIRNGFEKLNHKIESGERRYASLNDLYYELGKTGVRGGDLLGWSKEDFPLEVYLGFGGAENNEPCITFDYMMPYSEFRYNS